MKITIALTTLLILGKTDKYLQGTYWNKKSIEKAKLRRGVQNKYLSLKFCNPTNAPWQTCSVEYWAQDCISFIAQALTPSPEKQENI